MTPYALSGTDHVTVSDVLVDDRNTHVTAAAIAGALAAGPQRTTVSLGIDQLPKVARSAVYRQVGAAAERLLHVDLLHALVEGWTKYRALVDAGRRTLGSTAREVVDLVSHRVTATYTPKIEVLVDGSVVGGVEFTATLVFEVIGCAAAVASGNLVAIEGGDVKVTASLALDGKQLVQKSRRFESPLVVQVRPPVPLAHPAT